MPGFLLSGHAREGPQQVGLLHSLNTLADKASGDVYPLIRGRISGATLPGQDHLRSSNDGYQIPSKARHVLLHSVCLLDSFLRGNYPAAGCG